MVEPDDQPLAGKVASRIREMLIDGDLAPGEKLSEQHVASLFGISRNTLREVFRLLTSQSLLTHIPNRGVFVAAPDEVCVIDIYRVRRVIELGALRAASRGHPAVARMNTLVAEAKEAQKNGDWRRVGTFNMEFHRAIVELADSPRLNACFEMILAELRLVFGQLENNAHLHEPFVELNASLVTLIETGMILEAVDRLEAYLLQSERMVLAALQRRGNQDR
ncbi:GntR family transcriptional regulator [Mesorhizobium hungaricum]|jgi:DNA-binding GntR family transcriptional regulator|uniref:GntR family transcriptional regulator n=2 Tax=Phyllobacteriaceae TaxID=69277 RepID=A0A1C2E366_9HYPH|nr:GntR family transcriptional regulator [Mesorhizobium sp.]OCX21444.1 GntR family transcriptional regulator [Mesorhizobium hungaricum]